MHRSESQRGENLPERRDRPVSHGALGFRLVLDLIIFAITSHAVLYSVRRRYGDDGDESRAREQPIRAAAPTPGRRGDALCVLVVVVEEMGTFLWAKFTALVSPR